MSEQLRNTIEIAKNRGRRAAWSERYRQLFGVRPLGNIARHQRCCVIDDFLRMAKKVVEL